MSAPASRMSAPSLPLPHEGCCSGLRTVFRTAGGDVAAVDGVDISR